MGKTNELNIGKSEGECNLNIEAIGNKVVIEKCEVYHERQSVGIYIPTTSDINQRMTRGVIKSMGNEAARDLNGLKVGDTVLYDHLAAFRDTHPIVVVLSENVICKVDSEED